MASLPSLPRQYQPIWNKLKALSPELARSEGITVIAHRAHHPRIMKAIKKEKWMDYGYKATAEKVGTLRFKSEGAKLFVYLEYSLRDMI